MDKASICLHTHSAVCLQYFESQWHKLTSFSGNVGALVATFSLGEQASALALSHDNQSLYVGLMNGQLQEWNWTKASVFKVQRQLPSTIFRSSKIFMNSFEGFNFCINVNLSPAKYINLKSNDFQTAKFKFFGLFFNVLCELCTVDSRYSGLSRNNRQVGLDRISFYEVNII